MSTSTTKNQPQSETTGGAATRPSPQAPDTQAEAGSQGRAPRALQRRRASDRVTPFALGPMGMLRRLIDDLERLAGIDLSEAFDDTAGRAAMMEMFVPRIDVQQKDDTLRVHADLPGVSADDISLRIEGDALVLEGERKTERELDEGGVWRSERSYGTFRRVISLPAGTDLDTAEARFDNGVLEVTLRVPDQGRGRVLEIKSGAAPSARPSLKH